MKRIVEIPEEVYKTVQDGSYCGSLYEELKASIPYNPLGDLISHEALKNDISEKVCDKFEKWNKLITLAEFETFIRDVIDDAPTVEPEITEKQAITKIINSGWLVNHDKELREKWERPKCDCEKCDYRKFTEKFVAGFVDVLNKYGITSIEQLSEILKGGDNT